MEMEQSGSKNNSGEQADFEEGYKWENKVIKLEKSLVNTYLNEFVLYVYHPWRTVQRERERAVAYSLYSMVAALSLGYKNRGVKWICIGDVVVTSFSETETNLSHFPWRNLIYETS